MKKPFQKRSFAQPRYSQPSIAGAHHIREKRRFRLFTESLKLQPKPYARVLIIIAVLAVISGCMYLFFFSKVFLIQEIAIQTDELLLAQEKQEILQEVTGLKGKNLTLVKNQEWEEKLKKNHRDFARVEIKKRFPKKIIIQFERYPLVANIFLKSPDVQRKYIVNAVGLVSQVDIENPGLPYIIMESSEKGKKKNEEIISQERLTYLLNAIRRFEKIFGIKVVDVIYKTIEREAHIRTEKKFFVWLDMEQELDHQLLKLKRVIGKLDIYNWNLAYIDLRIGGKEGEKIIFKRR